MTTAITSTDSALLSSYIDKTYGTTDTVKVESASESSKTTLISDFNTFLQILTQQLQSQDPLSPMDSNEFTQELVAFAGVEQQIGTNDNLEKILSTMDSDGVTPLMNYVGQTVEVDAGKKISLQGGIAAFTYDLPAEATSVEIEILDKDGDKLCSVSGSTKSGVNRVAWDGSLDDSTTAEDGVYSIKVIAKNNEGKTLEVGDTHLIGSVTSIQTNDKGIPVLVAGELEFEASQVKAVYSNVATTSSAS